MSSPERSSRSLCRFLSRQGAHARRWLEGFEESGLQQLAFRSDDALEVLVQGSLATGCEMLQRIAPAIRSAERRLATRPTARSGDEGSHFQVTQRWYRYARAFAAYRRDELQTAREELREVRQAVASAVGRYDFLKPLAVVTVDLELLRARMARDGCRWDEMARRIRTGRRMMKGEEPLVTLPSGEKLSFRELELEFPRGCRFGLTDLMDADSRIRAFDRYAASLYALPGFLIES